VDSATVSQVLRRYAPQYLERFGDDMPLQQKKVLQAVTACRTGLLGVVRYACAQCGKSHVMGRSCGNRHCVLCQADKSKAWLAKQEAKLLPCHYFLITFTVPPGVQRVMRSHPRDGYNALFKASSDALKTLATSERHIGTKQPGFFGVLHTWGRDVNYHPHLHYVVAGGGLNDDATAWKPSRPNYYVPDKPLVILFKAKLQEEFKAQGLYDEVDPSEWDRQWILKCKAVGDGRGTLKYLAAYVFRVAVTENRITKCDWHPDIDQAKVTLMVKRSGTEKYRPMPLGVTEFIRRYLQHVLPSGFQKVRHYGFLNGNCAIPFLLILWLVAIANERVMELCRTDVIVAPWVPSLKCQACGGVLICQEILLPNGMRFNVRPPPEIRARGSPVQEGLT
jgi:hypothetical protein